MLMKYVSNNGKTVETSRDGVAPFIVGARVDGDDEIAEAESIPLQHAHWGSDIPALWHVPNIGDRIFVDMTKERAHELAVGFVERYWDSPQGGVEMPPMFDGDKTKAIEHYTASFSKDEGGPDVRVVDAELQAQFYRRILEVEQQLVAEGRARKERGG